MDSIPGDVLVKLKAFNDALTEVENNVDEFVKIPYDAQRSSLEKARHDMTSLFALNSLYWTYQACLGKQPKDQEDLSVELKRIKEYMGRLKKFDENHLRPSVNARGAKAFVRNALFDVHAEASPGQQESANSSTKRKRFSIEGEVENEEWESGQQNFAKKPRSSTTDEMEQED